LDVQRTGFAAGRGLRAAGRSAGKTGNGGKRHRRQQQFLHRMSPLKFCVFTPRMVAQALRHPKPNR
jgi:hypothetical protein